MDTVQTNKEIVRKYIEEVINTGNTTEITDYIAESYTEIFDNVRYELGIEGAKKHVEGVRNTYPDLMMAIHQQIGEGDWVATSYTMSGTHSGEWLGIKPTFKQIKVSGVNINKVMNGKICEHSGAANLLQPLLSIEAIKIA